jgi:hypothetical protein
MPNTLIPSFFQIDHEPEENIDACTTVRFNSPSCSYPEFPGCFQCDVSNPYYRVAVTFHYFCHIVAFTCCLLFLTKCIIAWRVVADELSNPTTMTPCGVVCITLISVAAGRGFIGEFIVILTSIFHILLSIWFLYIAIYKFRQSPDPGWFPNTVGIAYAAVKTWLYFALPGIAIMGVSLSCLIFLSRSCRPFTSFLTFCLYTLSCPTALYGLSVHDLSHRVSSVLALSMLLDYFHGIVPDIFAL